MKHKPGLFRQDCFEQLCINCMGGKVGFGGRTALSIFLITVQTKMWVFVSGRNCSPCCSCMYQLDSLSWHNLTGFLARMCQPLSPPCVYSSYAQAYIVCSSGSYLLSYCLRHIAFALNQLAKAIMITDIAYSCWLVFPLQQPISQVGPRSQA